MRWNAQNRARQQAVIVQSPKTTAPFSRGLVPKSNDFYRKRPSKNYESKFLATAVSACGSGFISGFGKG